MNQWSAGLERQLWNGAGMEVQYLGSHSYHLDRSFYNNTPLLPGPGAVNSRRPNPLFGLIRTINKDEIANYESMSVIFRQRLSHGLHTECHYTWSHTLDVSTDSNGGGDADESVLVEGRLRQLPTGTSPPLRGDVRLRHSVLSGLRTRS